MALVRDAEFDELRKKRDDLFNDKQNAWNNQNKKWEDLQAIIAKNEPLIDQLNCDYDRIVIRHIMNHKVPIPVFSEEFYLLNEEVSLAGEAHRRARNEYHKIEIEFDVVNEEYCLRLQSIKDKNRESRKAVAIRAGVPEQ